MTEGKTLVTQGKTLVIEGKTLVIEGKTLVTEGKICVTDRKTLVTKKKNERMIFGVKVGRSPQLPAGPRVERPDRAVKA